MQLYKKIAIALAATAGVALTVTGVAAASPSDPQHCVARLDVPRDSTDPTIINQRDQIIKLHLLCRHYQNTTVVPVTPVVPAPAPAEVITTTVVPEAPVPQVQSSGPAVTH